MSSTNAIEIHALGEERLGETGGAPSMAESLFECAKTLLALPFQPAVNEILALLGNRSGADRAWMFVFNDDATLFRNTHEWCRKGLQEHGGDLQDVPVSMIAWLQEMLLEQKAVMVRCINALPRSAKALRMEFERQKDKSVLSVPIFRDGKIWGCIGYDAVVEEMSWDQGEARLLFLCGGLIAEAARDKQVMETRAELRENGGIYLHQADGRVRIGIREIIGVKAERDYTRIYFAGGCSTLELRPLKTWRSLLPTEDFQQIHRGAIINVRRISGTRHLPGGGMMVVMAGLQEEWSVSRSFRADLRSRLGT